MSETTCKCCGQKVSDFKPGERHIRVKSESLSRFGEALVAYCGIEKVDLLTGTIILSADVESEERHWELPGEIRSELIGRGFGDEDVEYSTPSPAYGTCPNGHLSLQPKSCSYCKVMHAERRRMPHGCAATPLTSRGASSLRPASRGASMRVRRVPSAF